MHTAQREAAERDRGIDTACALSASSEGAYPAYLFSYWADWAQDPYKRPLSRAVEKRRDLQKSLGGHSEAGKQETEKR